MKNLKFKKVLCVVLGLVLLFALAACGSKNGTDTTTAENTAAQTTEAESKSAENSGKTLVAYFSATGEPLHR